MIKLDLNGNVDGTNSDNFSDRIIDEKTTRTRLLTHAKMYGFEKEMLILFAKYDKLLRNCTNEKEKKDIGKLGNVELFKLLGGYGNLIVDGEIVFTKN